MKYFTIKELCYSDTAKKYKIDNTPSEEIIENLTEFIENILDLLREAWGSPIKVNSGYRCEKLNRAVNGSKTSEHLLGTAYDIDTANNQNKIFIEWLYDYLNKNEILFSQLINEKPDNNNPSWVHLSFEGRHPNRYRCQYFTIK